MPGNSSDFHSVALIFEVDKGGERREKERKKEEGEGEKKGQQMK